MATGDDGHLVAGADAAVCSQVGRILLERPRRSEAVVRFAPHQPNTGPHLLVARDPFDVVEPSARGVVVAPDDGGRTFGQADRGDARLGSIAMELDRVID